MKCVLFIEPEFAPRFNLRELPHLALDIIRAVIQLVKDAIKNTPWQNAELEALRPFFTTKAAAKRHLKRVKEAAKKAWTDQLETQPALHVYYRSDLGLDFFKGKLCFLTGGTAVKRQARRDAKEAKKLARRQAYANG